MKKRILTIIASFALSLPVIATPDNASSSATFRQDEASDSPLKFKIASDSTAVVVKDSSYVSLSTVVIPSKVRIDNKSYDVQGIECNAFQGCSALKSIIVPSQLKTIDKEAFSGCENLTDIEIPVGVTKIQPRVFEDCKRLSNVRLSENLELIDECAFKGCTGLTKFFVTANVKKISSDAFVDCRNLKSIDVDSKNTKFSSARGVLYDRKKTALLRVPEGYKGSLSIPSSVITIAKQACYFCHGLTKLDIPQSVKMIEDEAFAGCSGLKQLIIPEGVTELTGATVRQCTNLTEIYIPTSLTDIGRFLFVGCSKLTNINVATYNIMYMSINGVLYDRKGKRLIRVPEGIKGDFVIPSGVDCIEKSAFERCENLTSVTIPASVSVFSGNPFWQCSKLKKIEVKPGSKYFVSENGSLYDAKKSILYSVPAQYKGTFTVPSTVTRIGQFAFGECKGLTDVIIPEGVKMMANRAFWGCVSLKKVVIPSTVTSLSEGSFEQCTALESVEIPSGVKKIYDLVFEGCVNLAKVMVPSSVVSIGEEAFSGCVNLDLEIDNEESSVSVKKHSFDGCKSVTWKATK